MLSAIVTTGGQEHAAVATLACLVPAAAAGVVRDVILVDCTGSQAIERVADVAGCGYLAATGSRAEALAAGAAQARGPWLMFIEAGAVLDPGWIDEASQFVQNVALSGVPRAGTFIAARSPYSQSGWRDWIGSVARMFGYASRESGLLIARDHYERLGGYDAAGSEAALRRWLGASRVKLRSRIVVS